MKELILISDNDGSTALIFHLRTAKLKLSGFLLDKGADINIKDNTGLMLLSGHLQKVKSMQ